MNSEKIQIKTKGNGDIINITDKIQEIVRKSEVKEGAVNIFIKATTSALNIIEFESGHLRDLKKIFDVVAPRNKNYNHDDGNGHSHLQAALFPKSLTIPIVNGEIQLGTWQQIVLIDFDIRWREREIIVQVYEEK